MGGHAFYKKLLREPKNSAYQILCFSCNQAKTRNNGFYPKHKKSLITDKFDKILT